MVRRSEEKDVTSVTANKQRGAAEWTSRRGIRQPVNKTFDKSSLPPMPPTCLVHSWAIFPLLVNPRPISVHSRTSNDDGRRKSGSLFRHHRRGKTHNGRSSSCSLARSFGLLLGRIEERTGGQHKNGHTHEREGRARFVSRRRILGHGKFERGEEKGKRKILRGAKRPNIVPVLLPSVVVIVMVGHIFGKVPFLLLCLYLVQKHEKQFRRLPELFYFFCLRSCMQLRLRAAHKASRVVSKKEPGSGLLKCPSSLSVFSTPAVSQASFLRPPPPFSGNPQDTA